LNASDVILNLVDRLLTKKEQKFLLRQQIEQQNSQAKDERENKGYK
jgi:hypothetical protein